jgi:hypothetical protein
MTVGPLIAIVGETGTKILDLNVECPSVTVSPPSGGPPTTGMGAGGLLALVGIVGLGIVMTSKK